MEHTAIENYWRCRRNWMPAKFPTKLLATGLCIDVHRTYVIQMFGVRASKRNCRAVRARQPTLATRPSAPGLIPRLYRMLSFIGGIFLRAEVC